MPTKVRDHQLLEDQRWVCKVTGRLSPKASQASVQMATGRPLSVEMTHT